MNTPHLDAEKVFNLFTEAEARKVKRLMRNQKDGAVRAMIVAAMRRAEHLPLSHFVTKKRERIILPAPHPSTEIQHHEGFGKGVRMTAIPCKLGETAELIANEGSDFPTTVTEPRTAPGGTIPKPTPQPTPPAPPTPGTYREG